MSFNIDTLKLSTLNSKYPKHYYPYQVKRKKMSQFECDKLMSSLQTEVDYSSFKDVDIVIEAVFEDINLKHRIIKEVITYHYLN